MLFLFNLFSWIDMLYDIVFCTYSEQMKCIHYLLTYIHPLVSSRSSDISKSEEGETVPNLNEGVTEQQNPAYVPLEECRKLRAPEESSQSPQ